MQTKKCKNKCKSKKQKKKKCNRRPRTVTWDTRPRLHSPCRTRKSERLRSRDRSGHPISFSLAPPSILPRQPGREKLPRCRAEGHRSRASCRQTVWKDRPSEPSPTAVTRRLHGGYTKVIRRLLYMTVIQRLCDGYTVVAGVTRRLHGGYTTVTLRLYDGYTAVIRWLHGGHTVTIRLHGGCTGIERGVRTR